MENLAYQSNSGFVNIATANSNLNGTGALGLVLTAASDGTIIKSITIKATGSTSVGMVRLFIDNGGSKFLRTEVMVPAVTQTAVVQAFQCKLIDPIILQSGYKLYASTQKAESFNIIAYADNWTNCACP